MGLAVKQAGEVEGRRRSAVLTDRGQAFEAAISERLRSQLTRAYRSGGLDGVAGARAILAAMAGGRMRTPGTGGGRP
jgi:DNA-binding MarR family transcriptional regulator